MQPATIGGSALRLRPLLLSGAEEEDEEELDTLEEDDELVMLDEEEDASSSSASVSAGTSMAPMRRSEREREERIGQGENTRTPYHCSACIEDSNHC